jgi:hypothetical protein
MGIESANYHFVPNENQAGKIQAVLDELRPYSTRTNGRFQEAAFVGEKFWIDTQRGCFRDLAFESVAIRVALCNPPEATIKLREILKQLLARCSGYVLDKASGFRFTKLDEEEWRHLEDDFRKKQKDFFKWFGERYEPISGEKVFEYFRKGKD